MFKIYRLINGDEIIGDVIHENDQCSTLESPFQMLYEVDEERKITHVTMARYMPFGSNNAVQVNRAHITSEQGASEDAIEYYRECQNLFTKDTDEEDQQAQLEQEYKERLMTLVGNLRSTSANTSIH